MNDENQDSIRDTLAHALSAIYAAHGVCVTGLTAEWHVAVRACEEESKKLLTFLEIEVEE